MAKWHRRRKNSKSNSETTSEIKNEITVFGVKKIRVKRNTTPYVYKLSQIYRKKKRWKEPAPLVDIFEENDDLLIIAEFIGFKKENLKVHIERQRLTLSAKNYDHKYYKSLNLPSVVIPSTICTKYKNGILVIRLKKHRIKKENLVGYNNAS